MRFEINEWSDAERRAKTSKWQVLFESKDGCGYYSYHSTWVGVIWKLFWRFGK